MYDINISHCLKKYWETNGSFPSFFLFHRTFGGTGHKIFDHIRCAITIALYWFTNIRDLIKLPELIRYIQRVNHGNICVSSHAIAIL